MMRFFVLSCTASLLTGCASFTGFPWGNKSPDVKQTVHEPAVAIAVKPQPVIETKKEKWGEFHIKVWDYNSFPQQLKNKVDAEKRCEMRAGCSRSTTLRAEIAACADKGICRYSNSVVWFKVAFNGSQAYDGQHAITGKETLRTAFGTTIVAEATPDSCSMVIPYFTFVLYPEGWGADMSEKEDVRYVTAHYVLKCPKPPVAKPVKKMPVQEKNKKK